MLTGDSFRPAIYLRNGHVQTILASSPFRAWSKNSMRDAAREVILTTRDKIRLLGHYSPQSSKKTAGTVILLHGWEGSADSSYILCTGNALYQRGYDIFRLNFRDHGDSHHLNQGIFYAVLLEEVFQAVRQVCKKAGAKPVFLVGFSLGGNFALRIARRMHRDPIENLWHAVAVSPVLAPGKSTLKIDQYPIIRIYFLKKWLRSLKKKQRLFPDAYDFAPVMPLKTIQAVTDFLLEKYSEFNSAEQYFREYSLLKDAVKDLAVDTTIIAARDDPIIPVEDFYQLELNERTSLSIHDFGGHNGFLMDFF
ncbi:Hydrolase, alpha/beta fold family functionally coupled to Phosphoribulokinase [Olavius sp. associated proteobacterium Delta 1]|nr:Hydrolase, alpha/beta fold family functionally coupled to Phosphoribulokinase [Olavius sp. associated proteobacterium Delta 1]